LFVQPAEAGWGCSLISLRRFHRRLFLFNPRCGLEDTG
jgi:hypothetical protein